MMMTEMNYSRKIFDSRDNFMADIPKSSQPSLGELVVEYCKDCKHPKTYDICSKGKILNTPCPQCKSEV